MWLEAALFEARHGFANKSHQIFNFLEQLVPTQGPIFLEHSKFCEREGKITDSLEVCLKGLKLNPKYSPLWF